MNFSTLLFWQNPEFLRHRRSELRTTRALTVLAVVFAICLLVWLGCWGSEQQQIAANHYRALQSQLSPEKIAQLDTQAPIELWFNFYLFLIYGQLAVLTFWTLFRCVQSISGERESKTWDFQRVTSLTAAEFLIGKLFGEPIVGWLIVLCCLPVTIIAAGLGHAGLPNILAAYVLILFSTLFVGVVGLWLSNLLEARSRGIGMIGTIALYVFLGFAYTWASSSFPGFAALSPVAEMSKLEGASVLEHAPTIFGAPVSWLTMSVILYSTFGAWFVLMILRSLKKDFDQIKTLSRWQAVSCATFLNFTAYALFQPQSWNVDGHHITQFRSDQFVAFMVAINAVILFAMGLAMISPYDHLKIWWRERHGLESLLAEDSPPAPVAGSLRRHRLHPFNVGNVRLEKRRGL